MGIVPLVGLFGPSWTAYYSNSYGPVLPLGTFHFSQMRLLDPDPHADLCADPDPHPDLCVCGPEAHRDPHCWL